MKAEAIVKALLEADPDVPDKDYALHLARRISKHRLMSELRAAGIQRPEFWNWIGTDRAQPALTIGGLFFGHGGEGAKHVVEKVCRSNGLELTYWNVEPHAEEGRAIPYTSGEQWWKFTADVPLMHFVS